MKNALALAFLFGVAGWLGPALATAALASPAEERPAMLYAGAGSAQAGAEARLSPNQTGGSASLDLLKESADSAPEPLAIAQVDDQRRPDLRVETTVNRDLTTPDGTSAEDSPSATAPETLATPLSEAPEQTAAPGPALPPLNAALKAALETQSEADLQGSAAARRHQREAIAAFYAARDFAPLWSREGQANVEVVPVLARLKLAAEDGLDLKNPPLGFSPTGSDDEIAAADIALSEAVVAYGREASGSRVDPHLIASSIGERPDIADPSVILTTVANAGAAAGATLRGFNPPQKAYAALRDKLAELRRDRAPVASAAIPGGPVLKVGMRDPRVPLIRARLSLDGQGVDDAEDLVYDSRVAMAVADFQKANGLPGTGRLTAQTIAVLSGGQRSKIEAEIIANMERWRWMQRDIGDDRIEVNIPDYEVAVVENGEVVERHRVVVGKSDTPTPIFSNKMQFLIVNPYWNVPPSIIRKEMMPKLAADPNYLHRLGYETIWKGGRLTVRQPPGERNALGRIKFMFPNDYAVYLHDTPSRALFSEEKRAFSHGCVRVDDPFRFAQTVLGKGWSEDRVKKLIGGKERYVFLPKPLPVHLEYFTAYVDEAGRLQIRDDIYGYSRRVKAALGLES